MNAVYRVPGRIELVGKHVDYAGGLSLTCATERGFSVTARTLDEPVLRLHSPPFRSIEMPLSPEAAAPLPGWGTYPQAVIRRLARDFSGLRRGVDLTLSSTLPPSAGLSSSSALTIAVAMALVDANEIEQSTRWQEAVPNGTARAEYFAALETGAPYGPFPGDFGVGVAGGAQDHVAIVCARPGHCGLFSYLPAKLERYIPWPEDYVIAVAVSGVEATKTGDARDSYNRTANSIRALCTAFNRELKSNYPCLEAALQSSSQAEDQLRQLAYAGVGSYDGSYLLPRLEQYLEENGIIVRAASAALETRDLDRFGQLVHRSQELAETGLRNQIPETRALASLAESLDAVAASAFGAGFGGSVWSMVPHSVAEDFLRQWRRDFLQAFPQHAQRSEFFLTAPAGPCARCE